MKSVKIGVVDYWMIHRLIDALRHMGTVDKKELLSTMETVWDFAKGQQDDLAKQRR